MSAPSATDRVDTPSGPVRGTVHGGVTAFRGIPFAAPPVGPLRFAAPQPPPAWTRPLDAATFGPVPPQAPLLGLPAEPDGPDDGRGWLTVNVWSPRPEPGADLPVLVWIHGGGYRTGHSAEPFYDGTVLARGGNAVVVTFNHRVGVEGFAHLDGAPANRGLLDQIAALQWVRDAIRAFGGDPEQVTVFGESAGAGAIAALLVMPGARGQFHRAIAQSVPGTFFAPDLALDVTAAIAAQAGVAPTREGFAACDPQVLTAATAALDAGMRERSAWGVVALTPTPFSPVVDGEVLPSAPWAALRAGAARDVEILVGHNRDEYRLFVALGGLVGRITPDMADAVLAALAPDPQAYREAFAGASAGELFELVQSDWLFRMPSLRLAEDQVVGGGRAHVYELALPAPGGGGVLGACHALDVPLVFGNLDVPGFGAQLLGPEPGEAVADASRAMRAAWAAFARDGDPGWPAYDPDGRATWVIDAPGPIVVPYPEETSRRLWERHEFAALPLQAPSSG